MAVKHLTRTKGSTSGLRLNNRKVFPAGRARGCESLLVLAEDTTAENMTDHQALTAVGGATAELMAAVVVVVLEEEEGVQYRLERHMVEASRLAWTKTGG